MAASAWQLVCGLDAWRVTQIPRQPARLPSAGTDDDGDLLAAQWAAALSAAISARVSPGLLAAHVAAAMRWALPDGSWLCEEEEPQFLASPYRWVLVLEALQAACRDEPDGRHPRSAEWERDYGRPIPGQDCATQLETVTRWHHDDQRDAGRLHAVAWGQRPEAALASAIGVQAGEADWDERVASQLSHFTAPCQWPLDHLMMPGPDYG
jgi:hypothetical protein